MTHEGNEGWQKSWSCECSLMCFCTFRIWNHPPPLISLREEAVEKWKIWFERRRGNRKHASPSSWARERTCARESGITRNPGSKSCQQVAGTMTWGHSELYALYGSGGAGYKVAGQSCERVWEGPIRRTVRPRPQGPKEAGGREVDQRHKFPLSVLQASTELLCTSL